MLVRVVWIVNKVVGVGKCNYSECKVAIAVYGAMLQCEVALADNCGREKGS